ncbi:MAG TPA: hypothetical protein VMN39_10100, partial [Longimicrobiaceae bacterium]|nr:hypothetical protein [Longimicrobiaceae bacterium]
LERAAVVVLELVDAAVEPALLLAGVLLDRDVVRALGFEDTEIGEDGVELLPAAPFGWVAGSEAVVDAAVELLESARASGSRAPA